MAKNGKAISGAIGGASTGFMAGGPVGAAIGGGLGLVGGMFGDSADADAQRRVEEAQARNLELYNQLVVPDQDVNYERFTNGAQLDPRLQEIEQLSNRDNLEDINLDPRLAQAKMNSLDVLYKIAGQGFTPDELNALQEQRSAREADTMARTKALLQQQDMRGVGNSDMALAQRMMENQSGANRGAQEARAQQSEGMRRSLDAIVQGGNLANQYENTDYGRQQNLAQAKNARELTNMNQRTNIGGSNINRFNQALESNVNYGRDILAKNTGIANAEQDMKNTLAQRKFGNQQVKIAGQSGANTADAGYAQNNIDNSNAMWGNVLAGAGQMGAAYMGSKNKKES